MRSIGAENNGRKQGGTENKRKKQAPKIGAKNNNTENNLNAEKQ